jgi:ankyrin repeat protein
MKNVKIIVPALCMMTGLILSGCDRTDVSASSAKPVNQTKASEAVNVSAPVAESAPAPTLVAQNVDKNPAESAKPTTHGPQPAPRAEASDISTAAEATPEQLKALPTRPNDFIVKAVPETLDMGEIATNETKKAILKLVNTGDKPMTLVRAQPTCGCTALDIKPNTVIGPNETVDVQVQLNGPAKAGEIHGKSVRFIVEGQADLVVQLKGKAVSFVVSEPAALDPDKHDGKMTIKSIDGSPFRIMSSQPSILDGVDKEPRTEHNVTVSYEKLREAGLHRQLIIYLDHPKCQQLTMPVTLSQVEIARMNEERQKRDQRNNEALDPSKRLLNDPRAPQVQPVDPDVVLASQIREKKTGEVLERIANGLDVNYKDASGAPLISISAQYANVELMQALLATKKVDIEMVDKQGRTPLMYAASAKNVEAVRVLLDAGANPNTRDKSLGYNALAWATLRSDAATVKELIDAGSEVEVVANITGWTPLICAAGFGDPGAVEPLLNAHANIEATDFLQGCTPLMHSARTGDIKSLQALIKRGANLNAVDRNGQTALMSAAGSSGGNVDKVKALIDAGADIHIKDNRKLNALDLARKRTDARSIEVVKFLEPLLADESMPVEAPVSVPGDKPADAPQSSGH